MTDSDRKRLFRRDADGYANWVRLTDGPLLVLAVAFVVVLALPYTADLTSTQAAFVSAANIAIWACFAVDYLVRLSLALDRRAYVRRNILDLVIVVLPFLRPLRAVRLLRLLRLGAVTGVLYRRSGSFHARATSYVGTAALIAVGLAAVAMYGTERKAPNANITTLPDALWWAATTVTTVGYGDRYPTTTTGRAIAVTLMVVGIALLGVVTAAVAAWFVDRLRPVAEAEARTESTLDDVLEELRRLHARLDDLEQRSL